jgi:hypothetical protein
MDFVAVFFLVCFFFSLITAFLAVMPHTVVDIDVSEKLSAYISTVDVHL